jgi:optic atrophy 3 protein
MAQAIPLLKLGGLLIRTVTKPFANQIAGQAKHNEFLSKRCASIGQVIHQVMTRINVVSSGYRFVGVKPLPTEEAIAKGASFMSETIIFGVAGAVTTFEWLRTEDQKAKKEAEKAIKSAQEKKDLLDRLTKIEKRLDALAEIEETRQNKSILKGWFS